MTSIQSGSQSSRKNISQQISKPMSNVSNESITSKPYIPSTPETCQTHVHEFEGSTKIAEEQTEPHNHRFAGVSSQVIPVGNSHVHVVFTNTDFFEDHHHEVAAVSGLAISVGDDKHVHFVKSITTMDDGHFHQFQFATLIQSPITNNN